LFESLLNAVSRALPADATEDVRRNMRAALRSQIERMDLVTREEFDTQRRVLERTRAKLTELEARVRELEARHDEPGSGSGAG
jgi:hypothetical protein